jgi:hypothetical protein
MYKVNIEREPVVANECWCRWVVEFVGFDLTVVLSLIIKFA